MPDDLDLRVELLKSIPAFAHVSHSALRTAAADARTTQFAGGTALAAKPGRHDRLLLILAGTANVTAPGPSGPITVGTLNRGDLCEEVVLRKARSGHELVVTAMGDVMAMELNAALVRRSARHALTGGPGIRRSRGRARSCLPRDSRSLHVARPSTAWIAGSPCRTDGAAEGQRHLRRRSNAVHGATSFARDKSSSPKLPTMGLNGLRWLVPERCSARRSR